MKKKIYLLSILLLIISFSSVGISGGKWYNYYKDGIKLMEAGQWYQAIEKFNAAIKVKSKDVKRIKTYGMHFIKYFPHRETGICFYNLGQIANARRELSISLKQEYSSLAQEYLSKFGKRTPLNITKVSKKPFKENMRNEPKPIPTRTVSDIQPPSQVKLVGERMGIAVLPFQTKGVSGKIGELNIVEQMMTTLYGLNRFKLFERSQLEKILEEQKLGMSGIVDASTAAEIGKGIGVDAIVLGSVTRSGNNIAINARLIDTETAEIITAQDEMGNRTSIQQLKEMINRLTNKIIRDLPLIEGYVIGVDGDLLTLDLGSSKDVKKGMKCIIYREGGDIIHPITKKVLGKQTEELGEVKLTEVYSAYSIGKVTLTKVGMFEIGNKVITK